MGFERIGTTMRVTLRSLARSRGFTATAVLTLAAGVGATTAIFSLANWALLRPVPGVSQPDGLVTIEVHEPGSEGVTPLSHPTVQRLLDARLLTSLASYTPFSADISLTPDAPPLRVAGQVVTPGFFETLGARPLMGRTFTPAEGDAGTVHRVAIVSYSFWRDVLDGAGDVLGRTIDVNGSTFSIVAVAPEDFQGPSRTRAIGLWVPASATTAVFPRLPANVLSMQRAPLWRRTVARPAAGVNHDAVEAQLGRAAPEIGQSGREIRVLRGIGLSGGLRSRLTTLLATLGSLVALLLALTVANLANLVLSRLSRRRHEASVRKAMGASPIHLTADLAAEGAVLAALGSVMAVAIGWGVLRVLEGAQVLSWLPQVEGVPLDLRVLLFALAAALATMGAAILMGAVKLQRLHPGDALRDRESSAQSPRIVRRGLVSIQIALALSLVVAASLLARSLDRLFETELGFDPVGVVTFSLNAGVRGYQDTDADRLFRGLAAEIGDLPGVEAVAFSWLAPLGARRYAEQVRALGRDAEEDAVTADANMVSPQFFTALDLPVEDGRTFDAREYERSVRPDRGAVVINRTLAERLFPGQRPVGREIRMDGRRESSFEVIGVVNDARLTSVQEPAGPALFDPFGNGYRTTSATFVMRSVDDPRALLRRIESLVAERDPRLALLDAGTLDERVRSAVATERAVGRLIGMFALLSLVLSAAGLFGLVSESVQSRTREFGIRTALGARARQVAALVLRDSLVMVGAGAVVGLVLAWWAAKLLESHLLGMPATDPASFAGATAVLLAVVLVASLGPAWRSTRIDPSRALRSD